MPAILQWGILSRRSVGHSVRADVLCVCLSLPSPSKSGPASFHLCPSQFSHSITSFSPLKDRAAQREMILPFCRWKWRALFSPCPFTLHLCHFPWLTIGGQAGIPPKWIVVKFASFPFPSLDDHLRIWQKRHKPFGLPLFRLDLLSSDKR